MSDEKNVVLNVHNVRHVVTTTSPGGREDNKEEVNEDE